MSDAILSIFACERFADFCRNQLQNVDDNRVSELLVSLIGVFAKFV